MAQATLRIVNRLAEVPREAWDALSPGGSPFLEWDWLTALEESGCAVAAKGWAAHHLVLEQAGRIVAACPMYLKGNSEGEFVFDHEWAHAASSAGLRYYPKLLVAVPFTPAAGTRLLVHPDIPAEERAAYRQALGRALLDIARETKLSSVHINFCQPDEAEALVPLGFLERTGMQYHWENRGYGGFDDYLAEFRSKRRTQIKRERRELLDQGIVVRALAGDDIRADVVPTMFRLYLRHIQKMYWGRQYLNEDFFRRVVETFRRNLCFVVAERAGAIVAGTFNVQKDGVFYGRYWGAFEELRYLHFNVCYYEAIDHCIRTGVRRFEPGAGGDFKQLRGFDPRPTLSLHAFVHPGLHEAVGQYLERERTHVGHVIERLNEESELKPREAEGPGEAG
jgi:predicted N-acyltransferase